MLDKHLQGCSSAIETSSKRLIGVLFKARCEGNDLLHLNLYMPAGNSSNELAEYTEILTEVEYIQTQHTDAQIIVCGDFNTDLTLPKHLLKSKTHALRLFMARMNLSNASSSVGLTEATYTSDNGLKDSHIDIFITSEQILYRVEAFAIIEEDPLNTSDHLPVQISLRWKRGGQPGNDQAWQPRTGIQDMPTGA